MEDREVILLNIQRYRRLLTTELTESAREMVRKLLERAEADLAEIKSLARH